MKKVRHVSLIFSALFQSAKYKCREKSRTMGKYENKKIQHNIDRNEQEKLLEL